MARWKLTYSLRHKTFAYHVPIRWWMFLLSGGLALVIALATISVQTIRAALANPAQSLNESKKIKPVRQMSRQRGKSPYCCKRPASYDL